MEEQGGGQLREAFNLNSGYFATSSKPEFLERLQDKHHNLLPAAGSTTGSGSASNDVGGWLKEGVTGAQRSQLLRSVLKDEFEDALELMAATLAYFRVASRRFADVVPTAIRLRLLEPLAKELRAMLREQLLQGLDGGAGAGAGAGAGGGGCECCWATNARGAPAGQEEGAAAEHVAAAGQLLKQAQLLNEVHYIASRAATAAPRRTTPASCQTCIDALNCCRWRQGWLPRPWRLRWWPCHLAPGSQPYNWGGGHHSLTALPGHRGW
jgi:hypothetical protein